MAAPACAAAGTSANRAVTGVFWSGISAVAQYLSVMPSQPPVVAKLCAPSSRSFLYATSLSFSRSPTTPIGPTWRLPASFSVPSPKWLTSPHGRRVSGAPPALVTRWVTVNR